MYIYVIFCAVFFKPTLLGVTGKNCQNAVQSDKLQCWSEVCDANTIIVLDMKNSIQTVMLKVVLEKDHTCWAAVHCDHYVTRTVPGAGIGWGYM